MRTDREIARRFRAIKKYYAYLRICAFNDALDGRKDSHELEMLDSLKPILVKEYGALEKTLRKRKPIINFCNREVAAKINALFRVILKIESDICGNNDKYIPMSNPQSCFSSAT